MQLHQLRYAVCVADQRQFTRAAAALHVAQPSVSSAVHDLERELGVELFHRSRGEAAPTAAGEAFLPWARQVLADCEAGRQAVRELLGLQGGRLSIGATPSLATHLLPGVLSRYHRLYPKVELTVYEAGSGGLVDRLEQGHLDMALVILPIGAPWVDTEALAQEELVLAVVPTHPLARRRALDVDDLRDLPLVMFREGYNLRDATFAACRQAGFEPTLALEGLEMDGVLAHAGAGLGAAVVPRGVITAASGLVALPFRHRALVRHIGLASRRDRPLHQAAAAFVTEVRTAMMAE
ncbi:MAG TPA: LysR substrate-binding domain-containing protein [Acidimicrobiales bacterium]|nr:LysR substrate-binding domain-containing protein [Acidimicrobiales bacterium]